MRLREVQQPRDALLEGRLAYRRPRLVARRVLVRGDPEVAHHPVSTQYLRVPDGAIRPALVALLRISVRQQLHQLLPSRRGFERPPRVVVAGTLFGQVFKTRGRGVGMPGGITGIDRASENLGHPP